MIVTRSWMFFVLSFSFINDNTYRCTVHLDLHMQIYNSVQTKHQQMCNKHYTVRTTNGAETSYYWGTPVLSPSFGQVSRFVCIMLRPVVCRLVSCFFFVFFLFLWSLYYLMIGFLSTLWCLKPFRKHLKILYIIFTIPWLCKIKLELIANSCTTYECYKV